MSIENNRREDMEKRKSAVLIAAQSLDNELRSVKNLKRLSIGSMDMLTDPDMEMHVPYGESYRNSWSAQPVSGRPLKPTRYSDPTPYKPKTLVRQEPDSNESTNEGNNTKNKSLSRRGAVNSRRAVGTQRKLSRNDDSSEIKQNLLWVRADQHPNVKPENYIELVQDALHNMNINESDVDYQDKENIQNKFENHNFSNYNKNSNNLSRRPSLLRKSYTEFDDETEGGQNGDDKNSSKELKKNSIVIPTVTLKDITEELTRISNKAGLTNNDAITLARTLSMASSYDENEEDNIQDEPSFDETPSDKTNDEEYASTMVLQNAAIVKSERNSLKRSKFTTYRIQNPHEEIKNDITNTNDSSSNLPLSDDMSASPSSINDIYDHYREPSGDWSNLIRESNDLQDYREKDSELADKQIATQETSVPGVSEEHIGSEPTQPQPRKRELNHRRKRNGGFWTTKEGQEPKVPDICPEEQRPVETEEETRVETKDKTVNAFNAAFMQFGKKTNGVTALKEPSVKLEHAKNRHGPVSGVVQLEEEEETKEGKEKRHRIDKKITNLFRRKAHHQRTTAQDVHLRGKEVKVKLTNENLNKFTVKSKKEYDEERRVKPYVITEEPVQQELGAEQESLQPAVTTKERTPELQPAVVKEQAEEPVKEERPALQPAVSVSRTKVLPYSSKSMGATTATTSSTTTTTSTNTATKKEEKRVTSTLPPRKLTFADVKRKSRANAPIEFTDSAFGFPLPELTYSTVVMFDHRLPINVERAIYRLSHLKLSNSKRALREQVLLSNFMYSYLNLVNHTLYIEQHSK